MADAAPWHPTHKAWALTSLFGRATLCAQISGIMLLSALLALAGCKPHNTASPPAPPPTPVGVTTIHARSVLITNEYPGNTSAYQIAYVRPQVNGVILKRLFKEGDDVIQAEPLYQIDPAPYQASLDSAEAAVAKAKASMVSARLTVTRDRSLVKAMAVSSQTLETDVATLGQDEADLASAQASVETSKINLAYTNVLSPISGRTGRSSVTVGALVTAEQTTSLVTVTQLDPIYVDVTESATDLLAVQHALASGALTAAAAAQAGARIILGDGETYAEAGHVQFSEVNVDPDTDTVVIRALFPNPNHRLLPGMFVRERIVQGIVPHGFLVPQRGVTHNAEGQPTALIVGANDKVESRILVTDQAIGTDWLVSQGIAEGDRVIVAGVQKVIPGMIVAPQEEPQPKATAATDDRPSAASGN